MADLPLPLAFFERPAGAAGGSCCSAFARFDLVVRVEGASGWSSGWSSGAAGLDSRTALRFLVEPARAGVGGAAVDWDGLEDAEPDESLADARVTLEDMRI